MKISGNRNIKRIDVGTSLSNDPLIQMYANAPDDIYQYAKKGNRIR